MPVRLDRRSVHWFSLGALLVAGACSDAKAPPARPSGAPAPVARQTPKPPPPPDPDALPSAPGLPADRRVLQVVNGEDRIVDLQAARDRGLRIVDLSDRWAPYIFEDATGPDGHLLANRYRAVFIGLETDRTDGDGRALPPGAKNYLEPYGIPPSLSVLRERFLADGSRPCMAQIDTAKLLAVDSVSTWGFASEKRELAAAAARASKLEAARIAASAASLEELAAQEPKWAKELTAHRRFEAERAAFAEAEKRLVCEGMLDPQKHRAGGYDTLMRFAMLDFQQKNVIVAQGDITRGTLEALARSPLENDFLALGRVLTERAAHEGGFLEDGSVLPPPGSGKPVPSYLGSDGSRVPVPDLVGAASHALMARLGLGSPDEALAFFRRRRKDDFRWLRTAVRFPAPPPYYADHMELTAEIDRGDVWYDFPFDGKGRRLPQPRIRYPSFTLYVTWQGEKVPLVRWRTTIGSWRSELAADGQEYLRYKGSDTGPHVWRHIIAAPVWVPPPTSPMGAMVKEKWVNGAVTKVTNYDEVGPGYLSAYGLVAGVHVEPRKRAGGGMTYFDNGIRTHGSFDYTSLRGRFSHGCHRLENELAVRMFSFVLQHRKQKALGPMTLDYRRTFDVNGEAYDLRLPTRGFYFELDPPLPIETLEGTIKGALKKPMLGYVRKPGVKYAHATPPPALGGPESKAGDGPGDVTDP